MVSLILGSFLINHEASATCYTCNCDSCDEEMVRFPVETGENFIYWRSTGKKDVGVPDSDITSVFLLNHGASRDGDHYFCVAQGAVNLEFCGDTTQSCEAARKVYAFAPQFTVLGQDMFLRENDLCWSSTTSWTQGNKSSQNCTETRTSSYAVLDQVLETFLDRNLYPNMERFIIGGHSAGGQIVSRYALGTEVDKKMKAAGIEVTYYVANPSSSPYLTTERPIVDSYGCDNTTLLTQQFEFHEVDEQTRQDCPKFNEWKYGLDDLNTYMSQREVSELTEEYAGKNLTLISGNADCCCKCTDEGGDGCCGCYSDNLATSCESMLGGNCRMQRLHAWYQHLNRYYGGANDLTHTMMDVPGIQHDSCIFQTQAVRDEMFAGMNVGSRSYYEVLLLAACFVCLWL